jgi:1-acyl-sn-glycerol-3-phosphate acyltransferase
MTAGASGSAQPRAPRAAQPELPSAAGARAGGVVSRLLFRGGFRVHAHGRENVPATGGVLLASNHAGIVDGPLLFGLSPRPVHALVKDEMFRGVVGRALRGFGQIALRRDGGDRVAITAALQVLRAGRVLAIFPEGTRGTGSVASVQRGAAWLALRSGAPIVPVACLGTRPASGRGGLPRLRARLDVVFGPPLQLGEPGAAAGRAAVDAAAVVLQQALAAHVAAAAAATGHVLADPDEQP